MLQLVIIWVILLFECLMFGVATKELIDKAIGNNLEVKSVDFFYSILIGFIVINTLIQGICLIRSIDIYVQIIFLVFSFFIAYYKRREIYKMLEIFISEMPQGYGVLFVVILVTVLLAASCKVWADDTYGYHAQTVRWIEEMGTVRGIANIHMRLGYNSAVFAISALYSFVDVFQQSIRGINGFIVVFCGSLILFQIMEIKEHKYFWGDGIVFSIVYYIYYIRHEISSLDNCSFSILFCLVIVLLWCRVLERLDTEEHLFYLTLFIVYLVTVKMNQAPLGLLCLLFLGSQVLKKRKYRESMVWGIITFTVIGVWMVRNIFVSGYLIYPFYQIDLFSVDWKVPVEVAQNDYNWIIAWARTGVRGLETALGVGLSWMPIWFEDLWNSSKILSWAVILGPVSMVLVGIYIFKKKKDAIPFFLSLCIAYVYWLLSAPSLRFGMGWVLAIYGILLGCLLHFICKYKSIYIKKIICLLFLCAIEAELLVNLNMTVTNIDKQIGRQKDYTDDQYDYGYLEMGNDVVIWFPVMDEHSNGHAGYWNFPATNEFWTLTHLELRGGSLKDGFRTNYNINNF